MKKDSNLNCLWLVFTDRKDPAPSYVAVPIVPSALPNEWKLVVDALVKIEQELKYTDAIDFVDRQGSRDGDSKRCSVLAVNDLLRRTLRMLLMKNLFNDKGFSLDKWLLGDVDVNGSKFYLSCLQQLSGDNIIGAMNISETKHMKYIKGKMVAKADHEALSLRGDLSELKIIVRSGLDLCNERLTKIREFTMDINGLTADIKKIIETTKRVLRNAIFEVKAVQIPTCFIITNQRQERVENDSTQMAQAMFDRLVEFFKEVNFKTITKQVVDIVFPTTQTYYFYFVDELTMKPILLPKFYQVKGTEVDYPIEIKNRDWLEKLLPMMRISLQVAYLINGTAALVQMICPPHNDTASNLIQKGIDEGFKWIDKEEETNHFLSGKILSLDEPQKVNGTAELRDLEKFYSMYGDIWNKVRLCKYLDDDGHVCWTTDENHGLMVKPSQKALTDKGDLSGVVTSAL